MTEFLLALGANLSFDNRGPKESLCLALEQIDQNPGVSVDSVSAWYRTPAFPSGSGPDFVNAAGVLTAEMAPEAMLDLLHGVERGLGRDRLTRWAPRVCDLDLLAAGDHVLPDAETQARWMAADLEAAMAKAPDRLVLPHPRMQERAFVLAPLADVAPGWRHPVLGLTVAEMLAALPEADRAEVVPL